MVIIYFIYPIILYGFKNLFIQTVLIDIFLVSFLFHGDYFTLHDVNIILCITLFFLGMIIIKYINLNNISILIISLFIMLIYYFVEISIKKRFLIEVLYSPFFLYFILDWQIYNENKNIKYYYI